MHIAIAGLSLESVSFSPRLTTVEDFERNALRGDALIESRRGTQTVPGGFIRVLDDASARITGILYSSCGAAGPCADEAFAKYRDEIARGIAAVKEDIDGILLSLHGAMTTPTHTDPDRLICAAVREAAGPDVPIMLALDYHANIDESLLSHVTAVFGYHCSPHIDKAQTGERAANALLRQCRGEISPQTAIRKPGVMIPSISPS